jgi:hypothetical protein
MPSTARTTDLADRVSMTFSCEFGHRFEPVFSVEAEIPEVWECPHCGRMASHDQAPLPSPTSPSRKTHWAMVCERRTTEELAASLKTRLETLRAAHA